MKMSKFFLITRTIYDNMEFEWNEKKDSLSPVDLEFKVFNDMV